MRISHLTIEHTVDELGRQLLLAMDPEQMANAAQIVDELGRLNGKLVRQFDYLGVLATFLRFVPLIPWLQI